MTQELFAALDACLNLLAASLMSAGYWAIRRGLVNQHRRLMLAAVAVSAVFLCCYAYYHLTYEPVRFEGTGWLRVLYLAVLLSHTGLAALTVPLVVTTLALALRHHYPLHRRLARWTLPIWWYVSVTGVVVYVMLYW